VKEHVSVIGLSYLVLGIIIIIIIMRNFLKWPK